MCSTEEECVQRSKTSLGSSKNWPPTATFDGFLSDSNLTNPDFYNWSVAFLMYCDGASFGGYVYVRAHCYYITNGGYWPLVTFNHY